MSHPKRLGGSFRCFCACAIHLHFLGDSARKPSAGHSLRGRVGASCVRSRLLCAECGTGKCGRISFLSNLFHGPSPTRWDLVWINGSNACPRRRMERMNEKKPEQVQVEDDQRWWWCAGGWGGGGFCTGPVLLWPCWTEHADEVHWKESNECPPVPPSLLSAVTPSAEPPSGPGGHNILFTAQCVCVCVCVCVRSIYRVARRELVPSPVHSLIHLHPPGLHCPLWIDVCVFSMNFYGTRCVCVCVCWSISCWQSVYGHSSNINCRTCVCCLPEFHLSHIVP